MLLEMNMLFPLVQYLPAHPKGLRLCGCLIVLDAKSVKCRLLLRMDYFILANIAVTHSKFIAILQ
jgi:hypothetical protein